MRGIIVAYDVERGIGKENQLPWKHGEMKSDMARFRSLTIGETIIMGRRTLESIGLVLPERRNIVISRDPSFEVEGAEVADSLHRAFALSDSDKNVYVIGGESVYKQALGYVDVVMATEVKETFPGTDAHFPVLSEDEWNETDRSSHQASAQDKYPFDFVTYERP